MQGGNTKMSNKKIRVHKEINLLPIHMGKESMVNVFYGLIEKYNKQIEYKAVTFSKQELWDLGGFKQRYNEEAFMEIMKILTKPTTFQNKKIKVWGSIFTAEEIDKNKIKIYVSEPYRPYLFYKRDLDLMTRAKKKENMSIQDLDYWDREGKTKSKYLVLLHKADLLGISGKYNKRLYALLMQFNKSLKYFTAWNDFKEVLEIPKSYKVGDIDKQILNKAKKELLKFGLKITKINKVKKGRSIDKIEILFKIEKETNSKTKLINEKVETLENEIIDAEIVDEKLEQYKSRIKKLAKEQLDLKYFEFDGKLKVINTLEDLNNLILEYKLKIEEADNE